MTNNNRTTLYTGVTSDLKRRTYEHRHHLIKGSFTSRYFLELIVYYELFDDIEDANKPPRSRADEVLKQRQLLAM